MPHWLRSLQMEQTQPRLSITIVSRQKKSLWRMAGLSVAATLLLNLIVRPAMAQVLFVGIDSTVAATNFTSGTHGYSSIFIGYTASNNLLNVVNTNTLLISGADLTVGFGGSKNSLVVSNGGTVQSASGLIGVYSQASNNSVLVSGADSLWTNGASLTVGYFGSGNSMVISNGGTVIDTAGAIGTVSSNNSVIVTGAGTLWTNSGILTIGNSRGLQNSLVISNGATVASAGAIIYGHNSVLVTGAGSIWTNSSYLNVGLGGAGTLTIGSGGTVTAYNINALGNSAINFGIPGGSDSNVSLLTPSISFGSGTGTLNFNQSDTATIASAISGNGTINQLGSGTTILIASNAASGTSFINSGALLVNGALLGGGTATLSSGASLGGSGIFARDLTVASGGTLAPSLNIFGQLTLPNQISVGTVTSGTTTAATGKELIISNGTGGTIDTSVGTASIGTLDGSTLVLGNWGATVTNLISGTVSTSGGGLTAFQGDFTGGISGTGGLVKEGAGTLSLLSSNSFTGPIVVNSGSLEIGNNSSSGPLGSGLVYNSSNNLLVGNAISGVGALSQIGAGTVTLTGSSSYAGTTLVDSGTLVLEGSVASTSDMLIGYNGVNSLLLITNGAIVSSGESQYGELIGLNAGSSNNRVIVTGSGSLWTNWGDLTVGYDGSENSLLITNGATVATGENFLGAVIGENADSSNNSILVTEAGSLWTNSGDLTIGYDGSENSLVISNEATVVTGEISSGGVIGQNADSSNNSVIVTGAGSVWTNSGDLTIGYDGSSNSMVISNGAVVANGEFNYGGVIGQNSDSSNNSVLVTGAGSVWTNSGDLTIGYDGSSNSMVISNGAVVANGEFYYGGDIGQNSDSSNNSVLVTGAGSVWTNSGDLIVGEDGSSNSMVISNGAVVANGEFNYGGVIGQDSDSSNNSVLVTGAGSVWTNSGDLTVGYSGAGTLTIASGGTVAASNIVIASQSGSVGTINLGTPGGSDSNVSLLTPSISFGGGMGTLNLNQSDTASITSTISGNGIINQLGSGTTILTENNSYTGATTVNAGTLLANNAAGSALGTSVVLVTNTGTLGGNGSISGPVTIEGGGNLTPGYNGVGALTLNNGLTLQDGATTTFLINDTNNFTSINLIGSSIGYGGALVFNLSSYTPSAGDEFTLFNVTGGASSTGDFSSVEAFAGESGFYFTDNEGVWSGSNNGSAYQFMTSTGEFQVLSVPEPSTFFLIGLGIVALLVSLRRNVASSKILALTLSAASLFMSHRMEAAVDYSTPYDFTTLAGQANFQGGSSDGEGNKASFANPLGICMDGAGNLYVANDSGIRMIDTNDVVSTIVTNKQLSIGSEFLRLEGIAADAGGNLYVTDSQQHIVMQVSRTGNNWVVTTIAGQKGSPGNVDGDASVSKFWNPSGIAVDSNTNLYVADHNANTIRKLVPSPSGWIVSTVAGRATTSGTNDGIGTNALFGYPSGITVDGEGNLYVTDSGYNTVRRIDTNGLVKTIAGVASAVSPGSNDGMGTQAKFNAPYGIAVDSIGNLYVADQGNSTIRKIATNRMVSTLAGNPAKLGTTNGLGRLSLFNNPTGIVVDGAFQLYVTDTQNNTIRAGTPHQYSQSIKFSAPAKKTYGIQWNVSLAASATSHLPVSFSSSNTNIASVVGNIVTILGAGTTTLTASQDGNPFYQAAPPIQRNLIVNKGKPEIVSGTGSLLLTNPFVGPGTSFASLNDTYEGAPVTYTCSNTNVVAISGGNLLMEGVGTAIIKVSVPETTNFKAGTNTIIVKLSRR